MIQLDESAQTNPVLACYQLAHECIHLLAPSGQRRAPVIEEGLATLFSEDYVEKLYNCQVSPGLRSYESAASLVRDLLASNTDAILRLRRVEPDFSEMTPETFSAANVDVTASVIESLLAPFERGG